MPLRTEDISYLGCRSELGCMRCAVEMRLFWGLKQEEVLPPSLLSGLSVCSVTIWKCPWKFKPPPEACLLLGQGTTASVSAVCSSSLAGTVDACWWLHERFASAHVCAASGECPQQGDNRTPVYFGIPCLVSPQTLNPRFLHHLGVAEGQINLSVHCSYLEAYLLFHIFSSDHL